MPVIPTLSVKIATWQDIRDKGYVFIPIDVEENRCPTYQECIKSRVDFVDSVSYADNQLVALLHVLKAGGGGGGEEVTINLMASALNSEYTKWTGARWSIPSLPSSVTTSTTSGVLASTEWYIRRDDPTKRYTHICFLKKSANVTSASINITISDVSYRVTLRDTSPVYVELS